MHGDMPEVETTLKRVRQRERFSRTLETLASQTHRKVGIEIHNIWQHGRLEGG